MSTDTVYTADTALRARRIAHRHRWSSAESTVLVRTAGRAEKGGFSSPWTVAVEGERVELIERFGSVSWHPDSGGRERLIACGAALTNILAGSRVLGWEPEVTLFGDPCRPDLVATVTARVPRLPTPADTARYLAAFHPVHGDPATDAAALPDELVRDLLCAVTDPGVFVAGQPAPEPGLVVLTVTDSRRSHLLAGCATQRMTLAAARLGIATAPLTRPYQSRDLRLRRARRVRTGGYPQLLLRLSPIPEER